MSAACICPCDYECPGTTPCECGCGGGDYLGCAPIDCGKVNFEEGTEVEFDEDGCPHEI